MSAQQQDVTVITRQELTEHRAEQRKLIPRFAERYGVDAEKLLVTLKNTAFKQRQGEVSNEQMMALLVVADQYHLNPFTREIYAFPDKNGGIVPVVGLDGWSRIINEHPNFDGMDFIRSENVVTPDMGKPCPEWIECVMYRKDRSHPTVAREDLDEVYRPPFMKDGKLISGPWQTHTKRMLRHKAVIQSARLAFGFVGIFDPDEAERIIEAEPIDVTPKLSPVKIRKVAEGLLEAVKADDGPALLKVWKELTNDEQQAMWGELRSYERSAIKKLLNKAKGVPDVADLPAWSTEVIRTAANPVDLEASWKAIQDAFAEVDSEVPADIETLHQDRKAELGA